MKLAVLLMVCWMGRLGFGAPAVSSVHVRFVSGNKGTQYSHDSSGDGTVVHYNIIGERVRRGASTVPPSSTTEKKKASEGSEKKKRRRLRFSTDQPKVVKEEETGGETKETKAVKRSPYGFPRPSSYAHPDLSADFGGNDFGTIRGFAGSGSEHGSYSLPNPEALAPEGVFHGPLPTETNEYVVNDPYLADPETAKYAAQHPPFFSQFPHKRTVLALNEIREDNGLEQNVLRSIRPFFPFFEISSSGHHGHYREASMELSHHVPLFLIEPNGGPGSPNVLLYAQAATNQPHIHDPWSIFKRK